MEKLTIAVVFLSMLLHVHFSDACCFPAQFEGLEGVSSGQDINGTTSATEALFKMYVDITNQKVAVVGNVSYNGKVMEEQILQDFNTGKQYTVIMGKCTVTPMTGKKLKQCLPPDAKLVLSTYYGVGNNKVDIDMYTYMDGGMQSTLSVTKDGCVPMAEHMKMSTGILDIGFMGLTLGIKDMSVFDIPKGCQNAATVHPYSPLLHHVMQTGHSGFIRHH